MSARIVEDQVINEVVSYLAEEADSAIKRDIHIKAGIFLLAEDGPQQLGQAMYDLNRQSVEALYQERAAEYFPPKPYTFQFKFNVSRIQVLKSLVNWLYQCGEGKIDETELYQVLDRFAGNFALRLLGETEEYKQARW